MFLGARWEPIIVIGAVFAMLLGIFAGTQGSRWWLAVPFVTAVLVGIMLWAGFTAS
jgi:hypothetical protein